MLRTRSHYTAGRAVTARTQQLNEALSQQLLDKISLALQKTRELPTGVQVSERPVQTRDGAIRYYLSPGGGAMRIIPISAFFALERNLGHNFHISVVAGQQPNFPVIYVEYQQDQGVVGWNKAILSLPLRPVVLSVLSFFGVLWSGSQLWTRHLTYESVFMRLWT